MARKKSWSDILAQEERILNNIWREIPSARGERLQQLYSRNAKVTNAADRYVDNILNSKTLRTARKNADASYAKGNFDEGNRIIEKEYYRNFSQRTYMGLSNG